MIIWSRRRTLLVGGALIVVTNAIALAGVAYNRSGSPDSVLRLTQRELRHSYSAWEISENSGIALTLQWRVVAKPGDPDEAPENYRAYGSPEWLDKVKLRELGFDVSRPENTEGGQRFYRRQLPREALVVLELDGAAYQHALRRTREYAARQQALRAANPGQKQLEDRAKRASELVQHEERDDSRLFVIDADLDAAELRTEYPDSTKWAIVHARVRPDLAPDGKTSRLTGYVSELSINDINVPSEFRVLLQDAPDRFDKRPRSSYQVTLAIGKRLEPWITAAVRAASEK